jgi:hypothetical protein
VATILFHLYAGQEININDIYAEVALRNKISQLTDKGYHAQRASIRHIVYWRPQNIERGATNSIEIPIVLPEIIFRKR